MQSQNNSSKKRLVTAVIALAIFSIAIAVALHLLILRDTARPPDVYVDLAQESETTYRLLIKATANPSTTVVVTTNGIIKEVNPNPLSGIGTSSVSLFLTQTPIKSVSRYEVTLLIEFTEEPHYTITVTNPFGTWSDQR